MNEVPFYHEKDGRIIIYYFSNEVAGILIALLKLVSVARNCLSSVSVLVHKPLYFVIDWK